jgi:hypothetical protein
MADDNKGWHGDPQGHAEAGSQSSGNQGNSQQHSEAGRKGGQSSQGGQSSGGQQSSGNQGNQNAAQNLSQEDRSKGGKAAHEKGTAHEFTSEEAREAGRKGGSQ